MGSNGAMIASAVFRTTDVSNAYKCWASVTIATQGGRPGSMGAATQTASQQRGGPLAALLWSAAGSARGLLTAAYRSVKIVFVHNVVALKEFTQGTDLLPLQQINNFARRIGLCLKLLKAFFLVLEGILASLDAVGAIGEHAGNLFSIFWFDPSRPFSARSKVFSRAT